MDKTTPEKINGKSKMENVFNRKHTNKQTDKYTEETKTKIK